VAYLTQKTKTTKQTTAYLLGVYALQSRLSKKWEEAADSEFQSLTEHGTWELVELPKAGGQLDVSGYSKRSMAVMEQWNAIRHDL